ncbi:proline racemase family protein [Lysinibacillus fusiformis]|uniref:proline racemase family protein n=1 Tax=Lysinibacillus fusiformis TaxID=28031 RepID=UPI00263B1AD6|nr:proline racemase family protein [Lysinibacillus fusiformis]MDC6270370.1 proline racemase family protein [Lysinibacillus sphaericus]MDN4966878.1 proline racemase family protein [Lysinibacillus fusiformis]
MNFHKSFQTIDTQVVGEAFRIIVQSPIMLMHEDILEADHQLNTQFEDTKQQLLNEPRGHRGMNGCLVLPSAIASYRLLFFQHAASTNFKYEALVATMTALIEQGTIELSKNNTYSIETIKGVYEAHVKLSEKRDAVLSVHLIVKPAHLEGEQIIIDNERRYMVVEKPRQIKAIVLEELAEISTWGLLEREKYSMADGVIMYEQLYGSVRSVTFERDGYILRSPGVDSTLALIAVLGEEAVKKNDSIFGSSIGIIQKHEAGYEIALTGYITGIHQFVVDREDPLQRGFIIV